MNEQGISVSELTQDIVAEASERADSLQKLAFGTSSMLMDDSSERYFVVSREYYSGLFYGFLSNLSFETITRFASARNDENIGDTVGTNLDIVGYFRDEFSESFRRRGLLRTLSEFLNGEETENCSAIAISFDWTGKPIATKLFGQELKTFDGSEAFLTNILPTEKMRDEKLRKMAKGIASEEFAVAGAEPEIGDGYCLVIRKCDRVGDENSVRRRPLQLMQLILQVGMKHDCLNGQGLAISDKMKRAVSSSSMTAYSVLYERERYYEKAVRQSVHGTMIKWGDSDSLSEFENQLQTLDRCNRNQQTHAAPYVLQFGLQSQIRDIAEETRNKDPHAKFPWYEMVKYRLPSLDDVLTTTPGLKDYEVRAMAGGVIEHLETHFWRFDEVNERSDVLRDKPITAVPILTFATLRTELSNQANEGDEKNNGSIEKVFKRLQQWRDNLPIQLDKNGIAVPSKRWEDLDHSLWRAFEEHKNSGELRIKIERREGNATGPITVRNPYDILDELVREWSGHEAETISIPRIIAEKCHGDPHFENIFIDASVPEDSFIVAIDPAVRNYFGDENAAPRVNQKDAKLIISDFGRQPMHDVAKLLLSTSGGYALAIKKGFSGELKKGRYVNYTLKWQGEDSTSAFGADGPGVSGAKLFMRSVSATPRAKRYQNIFATEVLDRFDSCIDRVLSDCEITVRADRVVCQNTYYIQIWAWLVRNTFSIAEKLFPDRDELSDQLFAWGYYFLHHGANFLQKKGPSCLYETSTQDFFRELLILHDMMEPINEK